MAKDNKDKADKKITIRFAESRVARDFDDESSLWQEEVVKLQKLVHEHRKNLTTWRDGQRSKPYEARRRGGATRPRSDADGPWHGPLLSIAIFGSNGSGKSSLMRTFIKRCSDEGGAVALPVIEPSLIDDGVADEHFLYGFLARIWRQIEPDGRDHDRMDALSPSQMDFQHVVDNLRVVDHSGAQEHDPLGFSVQRFDRHLSGPRLRDSLAKLIETVASEETARERTNASGPGIILLPVDDADISFKRLLKILDAYRTYLQHPQLVPVFAFASVLAEELLRVHFADALQLGTNGPRPGRELGDDQTGLHDTYSPERLTQRLAAQFLARLFPIQHRIRVRMGGMRVRDAYYVRSSKQGSDGDKTREVWTVLRWGSCLAFGYPRPYIGYKTKRALKPSGLRPQLQVLDVLAKLYDDLEENLDTDENTPGNWRDAKLTWEPKSWKVGVQWSETFDDICWTIMSAYREMLTEMYLYQEDLYGWRRPELRSIVLEATLSLPAHSRRKLIENWRHGSLEWRSQVLSLFAAYTHRPPFPGCEDYDPDGREPGAQRNPPKLHQGNEHGVISAMIDARVITIWFLDVWLGFYLPLLISVDSGSSSDDQQGERLESYQPSGWKIENGARSAMIAARQRPHRCTEGVVFFAPESVTKLFARPLDGESPEPARARKEQQLYGLLWCQWGLDGQGRPWAAINLWRVLGLIGQLLLDVFPHSPAPLPEGEDPPPGEPQNDQKLREAIQRRLCQHVANDFMPKIVELANDENAASHSGDGEWQRAFAQRPKFSPSPDHLKEEFKALVTELKDWRTGLDDKHVKLFFRASHTTSTERDAASDDMRRVEDIEEISAGWSKCAIRRLHGEYLIGDLWTELSVVSTALLCADDNRPNDARGVIAKWCKILTDYWSNSELSQVFAECPLLKPFIGEPRSNSTEFFSDINVFPTQSRVPPGREQRERRPNGTTRE